MINIHYPTRSDTVENLTEKYLKPELAEKCTDETKKINFVTHSIGGIMVRYFLSKNEPANLGKVVMLAPPNQGSKAADKWSKNKFMKAVMGPAMNEMTTKEDSLVNTLPSPWYEVGVIAGEYDEKASVEKTRLKGMKDFLIVPTEHTYIMNNDEVIDAVIRFLKEGNF